MKGIVNKGIQEFAEATFGADAWKKVKELAKCDEPFFSASEDYPDQMTLDLVGAASTVANLPVETVLVEFGKYWVPNTCAETYPTYLKLAGKNSRELLLNMNSVHFQVTKSIRNASPPRFEYEELPDGRLRMHYHSDRKLCPLLRGLILGVGLHFGEELHVEEIACVQDGAPRCTMEITFS